MRKSIVILLILIAPVFLQSQDLTLVIDKMVVFDYDYVHTGVRMEAGPYVVLHFSLKNETSDTVLFVDKQCAIEYVYKDVVYTIAPHALHTPHIDKEVDPNTEFKFSYSYQLLNKTPYYPSYVKTGKRMDYREMLIQILPTIKIKFDYKGKKIVSKEIREVVLGESIPY